MSKISVARVCDYQLLKIFIDETLLKHEKLNTKSDAQVVVSIGAFSCSVKSDGAISEDYLDLMRKSKELSSRITQISLSAPSLFQGTIRYSRSESSFIDTFEMIVSSQHRTTLQIVEVYSYINELLLKGAEPCFGGSSSNSLEVASAHHEVLTRLEALSADLIDKQVKQVQDLERDKQKFLDDRGADFAEKVNAQDDAYSKKVTELETEYSQRRKELDDREKKIDDADNTSTRRKTTTRTLDEAQIKAKGFNFSANVTKLSNKAVLFAMILVAIGVLGLSFSIYELWSMHNLELKNQTNLISAMLEGKIKENEKVLPSTSQFIYFLYFRILASSALVVSSIVYLIRWHNSWADRIAQQELDNQIFIRDLNRAQLAVEMSLEWNEKKDGEIPPRLLEAITEGLFKPKDAPSTELFHPAEQIAAAMLKTADKVVLPLGNGIIETSGKNVGKAKPVSTAPEQKAG